MGKLLIPLDHAGLTPMVSRAFEDVIASLQTWAGSVSAFGRWIDVAYDTKYFGSSAGTWTVQRGDVKVFQYTVLQDLMILRVSLGNTTTSGVTNQLFLTLPDGYKARDNQFMGTLVWHDDTGAGTYGVGAVSGLQSNGRILNLVRDILPTSTNWPNVTDLLNIRMTIIIPVMLE